MKRSILFCFLFISYSLIAQQTFYTSDPQASIKQAKEYFQKGYYTLAYPVFKQLESKLRETDESNNTLYRQEIRYYTIVCGLKLNQPIDADAANQYVRIEN